MVCETAQVTWTQTFPEPTGRPAPTRGPSAGPSPSSRGQNDTDNNFGNNTTVPQPATKSGYKFNDLDNNKEFTAGEPGIPNWPINLLTTDNVPIASTTSAADGTYSFTIPPRVPTGCAKATGRPASSRPSPPGHDPTRR